MLKLLYKINYFIYKCFSKINSLGLSSIDTTCPFVSNSIMLIKKYGHKLLGSTKRELMSIYGESMSLVTEGKLIDKFKKRDFVIWDWGHWMRQHSHPIWLQKNRSLGCEVNFSNHL